MPVMYNDGLKLGVGDTGAPGEIDTTTPAVDTIRTTALSPTNKLPAPKIDPGAAIVKVMGFAKPAKVPTPSKYA